MSRAPDFVRVGFQVRGEGATATEALASLAHQRAQIEAGIRGLKGLAGAEINTTQVSTQDVRNPNCSKAQPYLANQQLSTGDCAVVGAIATLDLDVKVLPSGRAGDVASMASQLGAKLVGMRGTGFTDDAAIEQEAVAKAAVDARHEAETVARAAGVHLGPMLRLQDNTAAVAVPVMVAGSPPAPPAPPPPVAQVMNVPLAVALPFAAQPITRTARVTVTYVLESGPAAP